MNEYSLLYSCVLASVWAFLIALFAIPSIIYVAHEKNLLDKPNKRTVHESSKPRIGGLAIFAGFISALTIFGEFRAEGEGIQQALAGSVIIFFIGLKDDIAAVSAFKKFFVQILATGIVVFMADIRITSFHGFLGLHEIDHVGTSYILTFFTIIGITNAMNLIDGVDGLAGSLVAIICITYGICFYKMNSEFTVLAFCLAGAILGFLRFNFHKALIFMGDTGSLVSGFVIAVMSIKFIELAGQKGNEFLSPGLALAIIIIPLVDTLRVFMLRIFAGISPFTPDKNHIHHRLMAFGISQVATVLILNLINIIYIIGIWYSSRFVGINVQVLIIVISALLLCLILEILFKRRPIEA